MHQEVACLDQQSVPGYLLQKPQNDPHLLHQRRSYRDWLGGEDGDVWEAEELDAGRPDTLVTRAELQVADRVGEKLRAGADETPSTVTSRRPLGVRK